MSKPKLDLLQVFRGFATLLVVLFHATLVSRKYFDNDLLWGAFSFGSSGIDILFVLSGFVVFYSHQSDINNKMKFKSFILKRLIRIYPVYWIILILLIPIYFVLPSLGQSYHRDLIVIVKSFLLFPESETILAVSWTLNYTIMYYLIFSLAILLRPRFSIPIIISWLFGVVTFSIVELIISVPKYTFVRSIFGSFGFEFAFGVLAAYVVFKYNLKYGSSLLILGVLSFVSFGILERYFSSIHGTPFRSFTYGISSLLIVMGAASLDISKSLRLPRISSYIGDASYSIFLIHYPVLAGLGKFAKRLNLIVLPFLGMSVIVLITIGIGCIFYSCVEKPLIPFLRQRLIKEN